MTAIAALEPHRSGKTKTQTEGQLWLLGQWRRTAGPDSHRRQLWALMQRNQ